MKHFVHIFLLLSMCFCFQVQAQGLKTFKLKNGMSVFIWEDSGKSDVFGEVVVRTGAVNDPEQYTGLAHYLGTCHVQRYTEDRCTRLGKGSSHL